MPVCSRKLHTSCSDDLIVGTVFGEFTLVSYQNALGEVCSEAPVTKQIEPEHLNTPVPIVAEDLIEVFPNPFAHTFKLNIELSEQKVVSFMVFDAVGNLVFVKKDRQITEGYYGVNLDDKAPGVYYIRVNVNGNLHTKKVMKMD